MANLTQNEKVTLAAAARFFNYDTADAEISDNAVVFTVEELVTETGKTIKSVKGIVGSMFKKGLFCEMAYGEAHEEMGIGFTEDGIRAFYAMAEFSDDHPAVASIEVFYDPNPEVRLWTMLSMDAKGNQINEADYDSKREGIMLLAEKRVRDADITGYTLTNSRGKLVSYTRNGSKFRKEVIAA